MDGIELIEMLQWRGSAVPIILASSREGALIESLEHLNASVVAGMSKPLTRENLRAALERCDSPVNGARKGDTRTDVHLTEAMLAEALRAGHIEPHYQPKVDMRTGLVCGVEALARWHHAEIGDVPPDAFIPLAERSGWIHDLTMQVIDRSFAQCAAWASRGIELTVAVNLSPSQLGAMRIVSDICALQNDYALTPSQIMFEVTETALVDRGSPALAALARLRLKGFGLSLDDYGTGFSSMQQLARIAFNELKLDRSFVHGVHRRKNLRLIVESALDLARRLELSTVAEGVETIEDWRFLQASGCRIAQGWLIAKAMPGDAIPAWIKSHAGRLHALRAVPTP
jgi:EAL domain-containing protein (putative c-di-GMP-specific phosphodiesterase class I)